MVDFDTETVTSEPAVDTTHFDWWQKCREKSIAEVLQSKDIVLINDSDDEIADDEQDVRKTTASETLDSVYAVKCFAKIHGDKQISIMLNELILKLQQIRQSTIHMFFKKRSCKLSQLT